MIPARRLAFALQQNANSYTWVPLYITYHASSATLVAEWKEQR